MQSEKLAAEAVEVLAARLPAIADDTQRSAADVRVAELYDLVRQWFVANGRLQAFEVFAVNPVNNALVQELLWRAIERDAAFARSLSAAVGNAHAAAPASQHNSAHIYANGASGTFQVAGRDSHQQSTRNTSINTGGLAPIVVLILILIILALLALQR